VKKTQYEDVDCMQVAQCGAQDGLFWGPQTIIYRPAKGFFTIQTMLCFRR
jgi:hypothetical protein